MLPPTDWLRAASGGFGRLRAASGGFERLRAASGGFGWLRTASKSDRKKSNYNMFHYGGGRARP